MRTYFLAVVSVFVLCSDILPAQDSKENSDYKLAVSLYNDKLYDLAVEQFRQFVNLYPNTPQGIEARFYIALTQFKLKNYEESRSTFQSFALSYPENVKAPDAWMYVAEVSLAMKNPREAALAYERIKTFHPKSKQAPAALLKAAEYYEALGDRESAKRVLRSLTQEYTAPEIVLPGRLQFAGMLMADRDFEAARIESRKVIDATKDVDFRSRALLITAQALLSLERTKDAENALNEVITSYQSTASYYQALLILGSIKKKMGNLPEASSTWRILADDSVRTPKQVRQDALIELGEAYALGRDYAKSLQTYERAAQLAARRRGEAWLRAGEIAERTNNTRKLVDYYARAVAESSSTADRRSVLIGGFKGAKSGNNFSEALRLAGMYKVEFPNDANLPRILYEAAEISTRDLKDHRRAIALYEEILERFSQSQLADDALFGLGAALHRSNELEQAILTFESLERRFPSSALIEAARAEAASIKLFELKYKEVGLEKIALLVGDVIAQQSRGDLAFRLADIYFHQLKDYDQAALQYQLALGSGVDVQRQPAAWFYQARCFEYLFLKEARSKEAVVTGPLALRAIATYDSLLRKFPASEYTDDAALSRLALKLRSTSGASDLRKLGTDFLADISSTRIKDRGYLILGNAYQSGKSLEEAALAYKLLLEKFPKSESAAEASFQLGKTMMGLADKDTAAVLLGSFLERNPNHQRSAESASMLGQYESDAGRPEKAAVFFDMIEKKFFYTAFAENLALRRGHAFFNGGDYARAVDFYNRHIAAIRSDAFVLREIQADIFHRIAFAHEKLGNRTEAKRNYNEYLTRTTETDKLGQVYYSLATIARTENNAPLAGQYLQESLRYSSDTAGQSEHIALEAAEILFKDERYSDAIARFSEVAQRAKGDSVQQYLQTRIIVSYFRLDNVKEADKRSAAFIKNYPMNAFYAAEFEFERGKYFLRKEDTKKAMERFDNVVRNYPTAPIVPDALFWTARVFELDGKLQQAVQVYDSLLKYYPRSDIIPKTSLSLGNVYYNLEQWDSAARYYKSIVDNEARSPELVKYAMNNLVMAYKELKLFDAALDLDRKYIEKYPDDPDLIDKRIDIGILYQNLGYYDQSILHLQGLMEGGNSDLEAELRYYIGEGYYYKGEYQQAILEFLKVPYLVTKRGKADWISTSYYMAGQCYEKTSKYEQALTMYKQIVERKDTDAQFKTAAQREIDRVQSLIGRKH